MLARFLDLDHNALILVPSVGGPWPPQILYLLFHPNFTHSFSGVMHTKVRVLTTNWAGTSHNN